MKIRLIRRLPFRALLAYAARSVLRVEPLAAPLSAGRRDAIWDAIQAAASLARDAAYPSRDLLEVSAGIRKAVDDGVCGELAEGLADLEGDLGLAAARAARDVAFAAFNTASSIGWFATEATQCPRPGFGTRMPSITPPVVGAVDYVAWAARYAGGFDDRFAIWAAEMADLERLVALRLGEPTEIGDPVDPSEWGPLGGLWARGRPRWWP